MQARDVRRDGELLLTARRREAHDDRIGREDGRGGLARKHPNDRDRADEAATRSTHGMDRPGAYGATARYVIWRLRVEPAPELPGQAVVRRRSCRLVSAPGRLWTNLLVDASWTETGGAAVWIRSL